MQKNGYNEYIYPMSAPAFTAEDYTKLKRAIALGAKTVEYADKKVEYRSLEEMRQLLAQMGAELGYIDQNDNRRYGEFSKGLC